jgi:hypothetical protein
MPKPTIQTQNTIDRLLMAGLKRSEFSVRTNRRRFYHHGQLVTEYGDVCIRLKCSKTRALEMAPAIAKHGLYVELIRLTNGNDGYPHIYTKGPDGQTGLWIRDFQSTDNNFGRLTKIA